MEIIIKIICFVFPFSIKLHIKRKQSVSFKVEHSLPKTQKMKRLFTKNLNAKKVATGAVVATSQHSFFSYWGVRKTHNNLGLLVTKLAAFFVANPAKKMPMLHKLSTFNKTYTPCKQTTLGYCLVAGATLYFLLMILYS